MPPTIGEAADLPPANEPEEVSMPETGSGGPGFFERLFAAETGPGEIADYMGDPLNLTEDKPGAQIARAFTGLFNLGRLAWIDLVIGGIRMGLQNYKGRTPPGGMPNA